MPNLPNFAIPDVINPENTRCICIQIPDDETWIQNFVGLLAQPSYWFNWQRTGTTAGSDCAKVWTELYWAIDWSTMSCCCDQPPIQFRFDTETGHYQKSTDGGLTWQDAPEYDPREISTIFPPPSASGIDTTKCQNADSLVQVIKQQIVNSVDVDWTFAEVLAFIATVILAFATAGTVLFFSGLVSALVGAIFGAGASAWQAAMTDSVYDNLRCLIFNNMDSDNSIDDAGVTAVLDGIGSITGIAGVTLYSIINALGKVGCTNGIRANLGDPDADCTCSDCTCSVSEWTPFDADGGVINESTRTDCFVEIEAQIRGDAAYYVIFGSSTGDTSCKLTDATATVGTFNPASSAYALPPDAMTPTNWTPHSGAMPSVGTEITGILLKQIAPFTVQLTFG